jgi:AcrR family transcriptional regulator
MATVDKFVKKKAMLEPAQTAVAVKTKRVRRSAEDAKRVILDAAERLISRSGPAGLRLQDVAAEIGLTHPVILHHFGSREGLMQALNDRVLKDLRQRLLDIMQAAPATPSNVLERMLESVFTVFRGGLAQRLVWLGGAAAPDADRPAALFHGFVDVIHEQRLALLGGDPPPGRADTQMIVYLVATAAIGDAVLGADLLGEADAGAAESARVRFRSWLSALLQVHLLTHRARHDNIA